MTFSPAFSLLPKLTIGLPLARPSEEDVAEGLDIVVVAGERLLSGDLLIGWRGWTYTCEPLDA